VGEEEPAFALFFEKETDIHYSGPNLDSGLFRVIQYRSSIQADLREKTGMTVFGVLCNERRNTLIRALFMPPLFALFVVLLLCCAE